MLIRSVLCLGLVLLAACGKDEPKAKPLPKATAEESSTVSALAPADSAVLVRFASVQKTSDMIRSMGEAFGASTPPDPMETLFAGTGVDGSKADPNRPMILAASFDKDRPMPSATWVLPFEDAQAAAAAHPGGSRVAGDHAALTKDPEIGEGGCALADGLLVGDVSVRVDVKRLVGIHREQIDDAFAEFDQLFKQASAEGGGVAFDPSFMSKVLEEMRASLDSVETVDCVVNYGEGGRLDLDFGMQVAPGSLLDGTDDTDSNLASLAARIQGDFPCVMLFRLDMRGYLETFGGMFDAMVESLPEEKRAGFREYLDRSMASMDHLDGDWAMGFDLSGDGLRALMIAGAKDGDAYIREYREQIGSPELVAMGMEFGDAGERTVAGTKVHSGKLKIDFAKYMSFMGMGEGMGEGMGGATPLPPEFEKTMTALFGENGLPFEMAAKDGAVFMTMGADIRVMDTALAGGKAPRHLEHALARVPGRSQMLFYLDFRAFVKGLADVIGKISDQSWMPQVPDGPPLPLTIAGATEGSVHRFGITVELKQVADFFRDLGKKTKQR